MWKVTNDEVEKRIQAEIEEVVLAAKNMIQIEKATAAAMEDIIQTVDEVVNMVQAENLN